MSTAKEKENVLSDGLLYIDVNDIPALVDRLILIGPPGVGKTERIRELAMQEAREMNRIFIDLRKADAETLEKIIKEPQKYYVFLRLMGPHVMPEDLSFPRLRDSDGKFIEFIPPKAFYIMSLKGIAGVLFIDEVNNVQRPDQLSLLFSIVLEKEVSWGIRLSDQVKVIMAGNLPKSSSIANLMPDPLVNRSIIVYVKPPSVESWVEYMYRQHGNEWETIVGSFLMFNPQFLFFDKYSENDGNEASKVYEEYVGTGERLLNFPTPRAWTQLAIRLYELKQKGISYKTQFVRALVFGAVGPFVGPRVYTVLSKEIDINRLLTELSENPSVVRLWDASTKIIIAPSIFNSNIDEDVLEAIAELDKEFMTIAILVQPSEKRMEIAQKYPKIIGKLANIARIAEISRTLSRVHDINVSMV